MADTMRSLLWHAGPMLGAEILGRLGGTVDNTRQHHHDHMPPALLEHALQRGDADGVLGTHQRFEAGGPPGDVDALLRLLEHDSPQVNELLFRRAPWPALRQAVISQRRFSPTTDPEVADTPLPLSASLRESILAQGSRGDLQAALSAADPELVFWALISGVAGGPHGGRPARIRACTTLAKAGRWAQLRRVLEIAPVDIPQGAPPQLEDELRGAKAHDEVNRYLEEAYGAAALCKRLRAARRTAQGRAAVRSVLEPPWPKLAGWHSAEPLPWGAAVALLEHPRCPAYLRGALLETHPRAVQSVARPGHEVLTVCHTLGEDQLTKQVLLHGIESGTIGATDLVTEVGPARMALTALVHGSLHAVATQAAATGLVRTLLHARLARSPDAWRELYTALPGFDGTAAQLIAGLPAASASPAKDPGHDGTTASPVSAGLPHLGRQSAWAYTVLMDIAGPEHTAEAVAFLGDVDLAALAGSRELPQALADHVLAHGGPVSRRVLAQNPAVRVDLLEQLVLGGDQAVASAAYRNPRCPQPLRQYILSADVIDADLRADLFAEEDATELWPLIASPDVTLLRHVVFASEGELGRAARLRAAHRIAELHGDEALAGLPDEPEITTADPLPALRKTLAGYDEKWLDRLQHTRYLPDRRGAEGLPGALADPGLDWQAVIAATRRGAISDHVHNALSERPDYPLELASLRRTTRKPPTSGARVHCRDIARHRSLVTEIIGPGPGGGPCGSGVDDAGTTLAVSADTDHNRPTREPTQQPPQELADGPIQWLEPHHALDTGALTVQEFVATGDAASVIETSGDNLPVARAVARMLHDGLGESVDAWVVLARLVRQRTPATLSELVTTARAAA
ncbi:MAG TPA: hypothetical protein VLH10_02325 [Yinghuangia sp.]|nr:hypothetical protein [Yinghuangia sp.]